jgi:DNA-binding LytR/AlgR family response regulator
MKVIIIEDEHLTAKRIITLLGEIDPGIEVLAVLDSVKSSVEWFRRGEKPGLVFMDIQLADGLSFDIFELVKMDYPVIFITAYQEYAIRAFKVNSVDYLLKPVTRSELQNAISKYHNFFTRKQEIPLIDKDILNSIREMISKPYKSRFMVKVGEKIKTLDVKNILYFYSMEKGCYLHTDDKRNYAIDYTLDSLGELLDPAEFFRINRRYMIRYTSISEMVRISGSKLKLQLVHSEDNEIYISRERLAEFKSWIDR